jgi:hypothetical protein
VSKSEREKERERERERKREKEREREKERLAFGPSLSSLFLSIYFSSAALKSEVQQKSINFRK